MLDARVGVKGVLWRCGEYVGGVGEGGKILTERILGRDLINIISNNFNRLILLSY